jgi:hypothetical protein
MILNKDTIVLLQTEDVQNEALSVLGRGLNEKELLEVKKRIEFGLEDWSETARRAIGDLKK